MTKRYIVSYNLVNTKYKLTETYIMNIFDIDERKIVQQFAFTSGNMNSYNITSCISQDGNSILVLEGVQKFNKNLGQY